MKKSLFLFVLLFVLAVGGIVYIHIEVNSARDEVVLSETVHYGDANAAQGLEMRISAHCDRRLFWDTTHTFGDGAQTETEFRFSQEQESYEYEFDYGGVWISQTGYSGMSSANGIELDDLNYDANFWPYAEMIARAAENAPAGQEYSETFRYIDYMDYYPLQITLELPAYIVQYSEGYENIVPAGAMGFYEERDLLAPMREYFRIPVDGNSALTVKLYRNEDGSLVSLEVQPVEDFWMSIMSQSVVTDSACYFSLTAQDQYGDSPDMSLIPGGSGIYRLSFDSSKTNEFGGGEVLPLLELDSLETVFSFREDETLDCMELSADGEDILLVTRNSTTSYLTVLDAETAQEKQRFEIMGESRCEVLCGEDYLVAYDEAEMAVIEKTDGKYTRVFRASTINDALLNDYYMGDIAMAWNGEKLALAKSWYGGGSYRSCGAIVSVYDDTGLRFCGRYASSLDEPADIHRSMPTELSYSQPFELTWK